MTGNSMRRFAFALLLLSGGMLAAADPIPTPPPPPAGLKISGPQHVAQYKLVELTVENVMPGAAIIWDVLEEDTADIRDNGTSLLFTGEPGVYHIKVREIALDGVKAKVRAARFVVTIDGPPKPPTPPPAPPGPTPPTPDPKSPFAGNVGLRVLVLFEEGKANTYPAEQWAALYGQGFQSYLDSVCVAGPDGKQKEWRIWPSTVSVRSEPQLWKDVVANFKPASYPWLLVGNGKTGFSGPLPKTQIEMQKLIDGYK